VVNGVAHGDLDRRGLAPGHVVLAPAPIPRSEAASGGVQGRVPLGHHTWAEADGQVPSG